WKFINDAWYRFDGNGRMLTGWSKVDDVWYFFGPGGQMVTGWKFINGTWYHFEDGGAMTADATVDNYYLKSNGSMAADEWVDDFHYADTDGTLLERDRAMINKAQGLASSTKYLMLVNLTTHRVGIFTGSKGNWTLLHYWECSTGKPSTPTVVGTYTVQAKGTYFNTSRGRCWYYTQFYGNYLFHSITYDRSGTGLNNPGNVQEGAMGVSISHGCVRLTIDHAYWIYSNIPSGTKVVTYK
ncbi:MAG: L,D-transpeptidase family protein, partial [Oscillospiraceae bacterium]|nr:L,D-transpeptidase family protein [Oscillospiraceae bacterium]